MENCGHVKDSIDDDICLNDPGIRASITEAFLMTSINKDTPLDEYGQILQNVRLHLEQKFGGYWSVMNFDAMTDGSFPPHHSFLLEFGGHKIGIIRSQSDPSTLSIDWDAASDRLNALLKVSFNWTGPEVEENVFTDGRSLQSCGLELVESEKLLESHDLAK